MGVSDLIRDNFQSIIQVGLGTVIILGWVGCTIGTAYNLRKTRE